jgi:hypothetical protein
MANEKVVSKIPSLQERIIARNAKRAEIAKEAQVRVAAAYTIAKTMLPTAPADVRKHFASVLLTSSTPELKAALRQTAINAHYTKIADTLREVHKVEMNQLMEASGDLEKAKNEVKSELKGDAKSATTKTADDRKDAGPQPPTYDEGARKEPARMDAENAGERKANTVDKTEGGEKMEDAVQDSARAEVTGKKSSANKQTDLGSPVQAPAPASAAPAGSSAPKSSPAPSMPSAVADNKAEIRASSKKACAAGCDCAECKKKKESSSEKEANFGVDGKPNEGSVLQTKTQTASKAKKADEMAPGAPQGDMSGAPPVEGPAEAEAPEMGEESPEAAAEGLQQDDTQAVLKEKVQEAEQAVQAIEQEITKEESEEIDLTGLGNEGGPEGLGGPEDGMGGEQSIDMQDIFSDSNLQEKASNLANEHHESADEDYFGPSPSSELEASLDEPQMASLEDMFAHDASADPMASLFGKSAASVEGFEVVPSSTGEAANKFKAEHGAENRDNESDHDNDILSLLVEGLPEQNDDQERVKQDATNELEAPAAAKEAAVKPALKRIKASAGAPAAPSFNVADALFASIDVVEDERNSRYNPRR